MKRLYILLLVIIWNFGTSEAQSLKRFQEEAVKATAEKDFARSLDLYNKIINQADEKSADNYFQAAESARQFRLYAFAEDYYKEVLKDTTALNRYRLTSYRLGVMLKNQAKYDEAIQSFKSFMDRDATFASEEYAEKAEKEIIDCEWAKTVTENGTIVEHLDSTVNTPNSEFGPFEYDSTLYYSSVRYTTNSKYEPIPPLARIFTSDQVHDGVQVAYDFNIADDLHTGNIAFNADQTRVYYTICKNINVTDMHCKIYYRDKNGENWGPVDSLSNVINSNTYTTTQPSIGIDNESGREILFFATDRLVDTTDHYRDLNIWCSFMEENGEWGEPGFIAAVNSEEEDVTPFFHTPSQTLYFSSNGFRNLGGFDIYRIQKNGSEWGDVIGMGSPLNSSYDEMYYTINKEGSAAYMSSNRPGGSCDPLDSLCVCNDIYRMPQICLEVRTFNELDSSALFGTEVALNEVNMNSPVKQSKTDSHIYDFFVGFDRSYSIEGTKVERWLPDSKEYTTLENNGVGCDTVDLYLEPLVDVNVFTCDRITGLPLSNVTVTISVVGDADEGFPKTDQMNLSAQSHFDLHFGKKYKIVATKKGYTTDVSFRTLTEDIEKVPTTLRDDLCICKLPPRPELKLYFANDEPGPHTRRDTLAEADYSNLVGSYSSGKNFFFEFSKRKHLRQEKKLKKQKEKIEKDNRYNNDPQQRDLLLREVDSLLNELGSLVTADESKVDKFFKNVDKGKDELEDFTLNLCGYLKLTPEEDSVTVEVRGFASPIGPDNAGLYNRALSKRRIDSIRKYFKSNLPGEQYPKLRVITVANGSDKSDKSVPKFGDGAIFGLNSSEERRVEIIGVKLSKCIDLTTISKEGCPNNNSN